MATNNFMVGVAYQAGTIPLRAESIEAAIRQSGVAVEMSLAAFRWGRMAVVDRAFVEAEIARLTQGERPAAGLAKPGLTPAARALVEMTGAEGEVRRLLEIRVPELIAFQDEAYAGRYAEAIQRVVAAERGLGTDGRLAEAAARYLYKLMAYKDEYEVARLHADPAFVAELDARFPQGYRVHYHLAPPGLAEQDPASGRLQKKRYGPWMGAVFRRLASLRKWRGTALDLFGRTEERRIERQLIEDYLRTLDEILRCLTVANQPAAVALASVPDEIRGYGHVKAQTLETARRLAEARRAAFHSISQAQPAA
jgi:indolepyruvate ferredoxin oxidoreductase